MIKATWPIISTELGRRIASLFIRAFGHKTLGLGYSNVASDLILSPAPSSNTARAGGIIYPIVRALSSTSYGTGPAPIYFNAGYMDQKTWWKMLGLR
jgi:di/tricarboxylate transporter